MMIALETGRSEEEIMEWQPDKFARWAAFLKMINEPKQKRKR